MDLLSVHGGKDTEANSPPFSTAYFSPMKQNRLTLVALLYTIVFSSQDLPSQEVKIESLTI